MRSSRDVERSHQTYWRSSGGTARAMARGAWFTCGFFEGLLSCRSSSTRRRDRPRDSGRPAATSCWPRPQGHGSAGFLCAIRRIRAAVCRARFVAERQGVRVTANIEESMRRRSTALLLGEWSSFLEMPSGRHQHVDACGRTSRTRAQWFLRGSEHWYCALFAHRVPHQHQAELLTFGSQRSPQSAIDTAKRRADAKDLTRTPNAIGARWGRSSGISILSSTGNVPAPRTRVRHLPPVGRRLLPQPDLRPIMRVVFEAGALLFSGHLTMCRARWALHLGVDPFFAIFYRLAPRIPHARSFFQLAVRRRGTRAHRHRQQPP